MISSETNTLNEKESVNLLTKERIKEFKNNDLNALSSLICRSMGNIGDLVFILKNLGHLSNSFNAQCIHSLLYYDNEDVRFWAVKNIGKLKSEFYLKELCKIAMEDESTSVKREAVSSIGRIRSKNAIPFLLSMLENEDPKIVCQAMRALLIFKGDREIDNSLKKLISHENEVIRTAISKEYFQEKKEEKTVLAHTETYPHLKNVVVNGDVCEVFKYVPDESIHLTFTSPPYYNARDYSIYPSYNAYLKFLEEVFLETYRITKEGRFLIVNTSPVIVPRISRSHSSKRYPIPFDLHHHLTQIGWEFIDDIIWEKPEYSVKNRIGGFLQHKKPLAYKPNSVTEYLMVYRKKTDKLLDWNIRQYDSIHVANSKVKGDFETTNIWKINPKSDKAHPAIFPVELCKKVIEYYSYEGDIVFDPFAGIGTLGRTAKLLKRKFFLTEKEEKYFEHMKTLCAKKISNLEDQTKFLSLEQFKNSIR